MKEPFLRIERVGKSFPGVQALDDVSLEVAPGEVHALVGENGAGKSTLIKILGGLFPPDAGRIVLGGEEIALRNAHDSQRRGISVIFQEFNLMPELTVAENIFIGREPRRLMFIDRGHMNREASRLLEKLDVRLDPDSEVGACSVAEKQMVEIAKALSFRARLIIMDEPTAALSDREAERLLAVARALGAEGASVLFVSHRLREVFAVADRITVLRDGRFVATRAARETNEGAIVRDMVGRDIEAADAGAGRSSGPAVLSVRGLSVKGALEDVSFEVRGGEIVGVAGLMGSGRTQLAEALYGLLPADAGEVCVGGRAARLAGPRSAIARGIGFLPEDRKASGILPERPVLHNLTITVLRTLTRWGVLIDGSRERDLGRTYTELLDIRARDPGQEIQFLSGGNQQKVVLGRALAADCRLLILCEPTRGVDVGAKAEIHGLIRALARKGTAILMVSSELPEIIGMSDRCLVMHQGRIGGRLAGAEMTEQNIMACATGHASTGEGSDA